MDSIESGSRGGRDIPVTAAGRRTRVLLVLSEVGSGQGGIENVGRSLMRLLDTKAGMQLLDYKVISLRSPKDSDVAELEAFAGKRFIHCGNRRARFSLSVVWQMLTWADAVIFIHMGIASLLALVPRPLRPIAVTWIHGLEVWETPPLRRRVGLVRSDHIVSNTEFTRVKAMTVNPWLARAVPCHLGISAEMPRSTEDAAARLGIAPGPHDILIVARMTKGEGMKGHDKLIAAMPAVAARVPDARLIIVGTGNNVDHYRALAADAGVADRVVFTGFVDDALLPDMYRRCAVFAMPSRQEGFGLVYLEAMRAGVPCVASNCDGAQEVVLDGETGFLVDPDDTAALAAALIRLLSDESLRTRLGSQGRSRFLLRFTERAFQERFWNILESALPAVSRTR